MRRASGPPMFAREKRKWVAPAARKRPGTRWLSATAGCWVVVGDMSSMWPVLAVARVGAGTPLRSHRDAGGARQPRAPAPRPRSDGPRARAPARRRRARPRCVDVDRTLLAAVPRDVRGDALRLPDDAANRAGEGAAAPRRPVGHRGLHGGRVYVARLVHRPLQPAGGRDVDCLPGPSPLRPRERDWLRRP